eukprot:262699_1
MCYCVTMDIYSELGKKIIFDRTAAKLNELQLTRTPMDGDGNCLLNSLSFYQFGEVKSNFVKDERINIVNYTLMNDSNVHERIYTLGTADDKKKFKKDKTYLEFGHVFAWHKLRE